MKGFDYRQLSPLIVKKVFKKTTYEKLSIDQCLQLLRRGHELEFSQQALEKLELYTIHRLFDSEFE